MGQKNQNVPTPPAEQRVRQLFLFRTWGEEDARWLATRGRFVRYRQGEVIFDYGTDCDRLLVLVEGQIQLFREQPDGSRATLHTVKAQALVACAALFLDQSYPASAAVVSPTAEVFEFPGDEFLRLLERRPDLARGMISALAQRLSELADRLEVEHALPAVKRVARWICEQPSSVGKDGIRQIALAMAKRSLAENLGMKPETLSRALRQLTDEGLIAKTRGGLVILDPMGLVRRGEADR